jgi:hypothetical protein
MGSFVEGSKTTMTQTNTPKFVEEVAIEVMQTQKVAKLFQTMAIINLDMGRKSLKYGKPHKGSGQRHCFFISNNKRF